MDASYGNFGGNNSGDIVLTPNDKKSKKKLFFLVLIILVIVIVAGLFVWAFTSGFFTKSTPENTRESFNKFANYVVSGEESVVAIDPDFSLSKNYFFSDNDLTNEQKSTVYKKTKKLFDNFLNRYNSLSSEEKKMIVSDLSMFVTWSKNSSRLIDFISVVYRKNLIGNEDFFDIYRKKGDSTAQDIIEEYYGGLSSLEENTIAADFLDGLNNWINLKIKSVEYISKNGCLGDSYAESDECMASGKVASVTNEYNEMKKSAEYIYRRDLQSSHDYLDNFVLYVFILNSLINNGDVSNYVFTK